MLKEISRKGIYLDIDDLVSKFGLNAFWFIAKEVAYGEVLKPGKKDIEARVFYVEMAFDTCHVYIVKNGLKGFQKLIFDEKTGELTPSSKFYYSDVEVLNQIAASGVWT